LLFKGQPVTPGAIKKTFLLTVEGEKDDICAVGQTLAAQDLCTGLRPYMKSHHMQPGVAITAFSTGGAGTVRSIRSCATTSSRASEGAAPLIDWIRGTHRAGARPLEATTALRPLCQKAPLLVRCPAGSRRNSSHGPRLRDATWQGDHQGMTEAEPRAISCSALGDASGPRHRVPLVIA